MNTQSKTHGLITDRTELAKHLGAIRREFGATVPEDFEWWLTDGCASVFAGWIWLGDVANLLQRERRADTIDELLTEWRQIDWAAERSAAKNVRATPFGVVPAAVEQVP